MPTGSRDRERAADGGRTDRTLHRAGGEVARPGLARVGREALELLALEPHLDAAVEDADRRGHGAGLTHRCFALETDFDPVRSREPVRDERRLERDDGAIGVEGFANLLRHGEQLGHAGRSISTNRNTPPFVSCAKDRVRTKPARSYTVIARALNSATASRKRAGANRSRANSRPCLDE